MTSIGAKPNQIPVNGMLGTMAFQDAEAVNIPAGKIGNKTVAELNSAASDAREWTAETVSEDEARGGTSTTRRAWNALRVFQAIAAWWAGSEAKQKLDNIAAEATKNESDEHLLDRTNHTGTQAVSTVEGLAEALAAKQDISSVVTISASRALALSDAGNYLRPTATVTLTVPTNASVAFEIGTEITIRALGNITLAAASGVTLYAPSGGTLSMTADMTVTLKKVGTNEWDVIGQTVAA